MITGSTGFIGSALVRNAPEEVNLYLPTHDDLLDHTLHSADHIIHAAGYAAPAKFTADPWETIEVNTTCVMALLGVLKPEGSFLFCSSCEVYKGLTHEATEDEMGRTTPYHSRACYIEGKRCGETILNGWDGRTIAARIGLTYGPGTQRHDERVLNQFIEQALTTGEIKLKDNGAAELTYGYVDDMAKILWKLLDSGIHPVYNVGGIDSMTVLELALRIAQIVGDVGLKLPDNPGGSAQGKMCLDRIQAEFPIQYTNFEEGLRKTIEYQRGLYV